uniref:Uncharacterized protein n=1 Tax=viral metagenome TaxID=1070528 RepID=A0A6C0I6Q8_9ZZZZ
MCWSFDVSLGTFIFGTLCSIYLYTRNGPNDIFYAVYIFVIGLMQGADAIAWYSIDNSIPSLNKFAAILSFILINIQIPTIYLYLYKTTGQKLYLNVVIAYMGYILYTLYQIWVQYDSIKITVKPNCKNECHLDWSWLVPIRNIIHWIIVFLYLFLLVYPIMLIRNQKKYLMIMISVLTFMYSLYKFRETNIWGSYWCSMINLWAIVAVFY